MDQRALRGLVRGERKAMTNDEKAVTMPNAIKVL
jgi:hypothetical protein